MNVCKRFSIILFALGLFLSVIAITSIPVLATEIDAEGTVVAVEGLPALPSGLNPSMDSSQLTDVQLTDIVNATFNFWLPNVAGYEKACAKAAIAAATKLYQQKNGGDLNGLQYFLKCVCLSFRTIDASSGVGKYLAFRTAGNSLLLVDKSLAENGITEDVIDWSKFTEQAGLTAVRKYIDPSSGETKTEERPANSSDVAVTSDVFKEMVESANTTNVPKGKGLWKSSYRTDRVIHLNYDSSMITLWGSADIGDRFSDEIYIYPFYTDYNGITYYGDYQFRLYYDMYINGDITDYAVYVETYRYLNGAGWVLQSDYSGCVLDGSSMVKPYTICLRFPYYTSSSKPHLVLGFYEAESDYYKASSRSPMKYGHGLFELPSDSYNFSNGNESVSLFYSPASFDKKYSSFYYEADGKVITAPERTDIDIGYICSSEMISRTYSDVDTTKIPDNYYVTISGDTIYDYSITNPETGQSDTINYYITNNYTLPDNGGSSGGGSGSSGSVGGDVTVGGKIDVDGTVSVDVNVNVNGGAGGTNFGDVNTDPLDDYLNSALDESSGFRAFLGDFFSFLPVELLVLLGIGLSFVIIGRIMGR